MKTATFRSLAGSVLILAAGLASAVEDLPKEVMINGVEFVQIPAGEFFKTGGVASSKEKYRFYNNYFAEPGNVKVWLDTYYIAKYEGRARHFADFLNDPAPGPEKTAVSSASCSVQLAGDGRYSVLQSENDHPATNLSWEVADRWAKWMGFRLPSEAEWEKAARGPDRRSYPWGDDQPDDTFAGFNSGGGCRTWPVHSFEKGKSPYGIYNMAGNVREYVADWYDAEADKALADGARNPRGQHGSVRVNGIPGEDGPWKFLKGGRWASWPIEMRVDYRSYFAPEETFRCNGARFALDADVVREHLKNGRAQVLKP